MHRYTSGFALFYPYCCCMLVLFKTRKNLVWFFFLCVLTKHHKLNIPYIWEPKKKICCSDAWILFFVFGDAALCLRLKEVHIPSHTVVNSTVRFECHYDLDGQKLYSVKWYKELNEFYRYVPRDFPAATVFSLPGIHVNVQYKYKFKIYIFFLHF